MMEARNSGVLRTIHLLITICILSFPAQAQYGGGTGEPNDPYLIYTAEQLNEIGLHEDDWDKHFKLMADIDLSIYTGTDFSIIGDSDFPFTGVFDGNGHTISNLSYTSTDRHYVGLFGFVDDPNAQIINLGLVNPDIEEGTGAFVGSLVGLLKTGRIVGCYVEDGSVSGKSIVGGLIGNNTGTVDGCYSTCNVTGEDEIGGLIGRNTGTVDGCYSTCNVTGERVVGGLVGQNGFIFGWSMIMYSGTISNCYSTGSTSGNENVGGLVGFYYVGIITNCYATGKVLENKYVGGLVGTVVIGLVEACFWDIETSGQTKSAGGIGETTTEIQTANTFLEAGWDFVGETANGTEDIWWILEGQDYPRLIWELPEGLRLQPLRAFSPDPQDGATDVAQSPILHWAPAEATLLHDIYIGEDKEEVANATTLSSGIFRGRQAGELSTYEPGKLEWDATYYWRIDEVNEADPNSLCKGSVWSFTTANFLIVEDFESYNVYEAADPNSNSIFNTWIDVLESTTIGVASRNFPFHFPMNIGIIQFSPTQVMRYLYRNSGPVYYSEATANTAHLAIGQDWIQDGAGILSLWFDGYEGNAPEPMYVAVANARGPTAVVYHDNPDAATINTPAEWTIDLQLFADQGVDLTNINTISIGFGDKDNPQPGGSGCVFFDDIRLYRSP